MLQPTHDLIFIKKFQPEHQSTLVIIENTDEPEGIVVAVGPGKTYSTGDLIPVDVKVGDKVIYSKHAGQTFKVDDQELIAIREQDIFAVIE